MASTSTPTSASTSPDSPNPDLLAVLVQRTMGIWQGSDRLSIRVETIRGPR